MGDTITYIIIGLFAIFFIYFIYTLVDTLLLSRRHRRPKEVTQENRPKGSSSQDTKASAEESFEDAQKTGDRSAKDTSAEDEKQDDALADSASSAEKETDADEDKSAKDGFRQDSAVKELKKPSLFARLGQLIPKRDKKQKVKKPVSADASRQKEPVLESEKVDGQYETMIASFVDAHQGGWKQKEFYEFLLEIVAKGYDKRPSEVQEDLEVLRRKKEEEAKDRQKTKLEKDADPSDGAPDHGKNDEKDGAKSNDAKDTSHTKDKSKGGNDDGEKELKKLVKEKKENADTKSELNKTLDELRAIRERLSKIE